MQNGPSQHGETAAGIAKRDAILATINRLAAAGEACPTLPELSALLAVKPETLRYHLALLVRRGVLVAKLTRRMEYCIRREDAP